MRPSMFDNRTRGRSLAFIFAGGVIVGTLTLALPHDADIDPAAVFVLDAVALALAALFVRFADELSEMLVHLALGAGTVILSFGVHYTEQATLFPLIYMWTALYAFYFFPIGPALGHLAFIGIAYGTVLAIDDTPDATIRLVLVMGTPLVVGLLISRLQADMRAGIERSARQEKALRISEQRTRLIVDSAQDGFVSTDARGRVLDLNGAAEHLLGRPRAEIVGRGFDELGIPPDFRDEFNERRDALLASAREGRTRHVELRVAFDRPDGTRLRAETMIWAVEREGEWMFNARLTDIGERLHREQAREELVRAEAARAEAERATATIARLQAVADAALTERDLDVLGPRILARTRDVLDADAAALLLMQDDGTLSLLASDGISAPDRPQRVPADAGLAGRVLAAGAPVLLQDPTADELADPIVLEAGVTSMLGVPLVSHGEVIGVIEVGVCPPRRLSDDDADLLRLTADRVALAIDHARAFDREHRIAETLQRSLLPQSLPALPGVTLTARYLPAASEAEVGGDWYDAIPLTGGRVLLVMGDVSGKGLAAASTLGALRNAIRAYALEGHPPAEIAERVNGFVLADPSREHMATLVLAVFDPVEARLTYVNAGHPPPLALDADGTPHFLERGRSVPLGVLPFPGYEEDTAALVPGGAVVLYTDGLIERRGEHLDEGLEVLARAAGAGPLEPDALCERLLAAALPAGATSDDVALLALCHVPLGERLELDLPSEPGSLRALRAMLRRWLAQAGATDADVHAIVMACSEACTNAIEHAGADAMEPIAFLAVVRDGEVDVTVRDRGRWRDERPPSDQGRGLELIEALMDAVRVEKGPEGTTVRLRRKLCQPVGA